MRHKKQTYAQIMQEFRNKFEEENKNKSQGSGLVEQKKVEPTKNLAKIDIKTGEPPKVTYQKLEGSEKLKKFINFKI